MLDGTGRETRKPYLLEQECNRLFAESLPVLLGTKPEIVGYGAGEEEWSLGYHPHSSPQVGWRDGAIIFSFKVDCAAGRFVKTIQEAEQGRLARTAWSRHP